MDPVVKDSIDASRRSAHGGACSLKEDLIVEFKIILFHNQSECVDNRLDQHALTVFRV